VAPLPADRFASYDELLQAVELMSVEHTRPAGFVARAIATGLDVLFVGIVLALLTAIPGAGEIRIGPLVFVVAAVYLALAIGRWGTTLGKALFELEVVTIERSNRPSWSAAIRRTAVLGALPLVGSVLTLVADGFGLPGRDLGGIVTVASLPLLAGLLLYASLITPGKRAPWDRLAGTIVRYRQLSARSRR
jgi:uncharacterized RDD family membrane protein YckC